MFAIIHKPQFIEQGVSLLMQSKQKSVLIVEDCADTRNLMKFLIECEGFIVYEAEDGSQAVKSAGEYLPDLILMDMSMPVMDGLTATRKLKAESATSNLPIVAVTAHGKLFYDKALHAGCNELIGKPVDFDVLNEILRRYISN